MKRNQNQSQAGFTVTELLVVFLIMILLSSLVIISWNAQVPRRSMVLAQNEMVTNIRKIQGYAVTSRNINTTQSAKYYVMRFGANEDFYTVYGIDSDGNATAALETVNLPQEVSVISIHLVNQSTGITTGHDCAYLVFSVVYGKTYVLGDSVCTIDQVTSIINDPPELARRANYDLFLQNGHERSARAYGVQIDSQTGNVETFTPKRAGSSNWK